MKHSFVYLHLIILSLLLISACNKQPLKEYSGDAYAQFGPPLSRINFQGDQLLDTQKLYTFAYGSPDRTEDTVYFDLYVLGGPSNVRRYYRLQQNILNGSVNAISGVHYLAFDNSKSIAGFTVEPGQIHAMVPIVVYRDPSLKTGEVVLQFSIIANEWFQPGETIKIWRRLKITDQLQKPTAWNDYAVTNLWGAYSRVKHEFMIQQTGEKWDEAFMTDLNANIGYALYWKGKLKELLAAYNVAHSNNLLKDENGIPVLFP